MCRWLWRYLNQVHFFSSHISSLSRTQNFISCPNTRTGLGTTTVSAERYESRIRFPGIASHWRLWRRAIEWKTGDVRDQGLKSGDGRLIHKLHRQSQIAEEFFTVERALELTERLAAKCVLTVNDRRLNICGKRLLSLTEVERRWELLFRYGTLNIIIMEGRRWGRVRWS